MSLSSSGAQGCDTAVGAAVRALGSCRSWAGVPAHSGAPTREENQPLPSIVFSTLGASISGKGSPLGGQCRNLT